MKYYVNFYGKGIEFTKHQIDRMLAAGDIEEHDVCKVLP